MRELAEEGRTMMVVTHEMSFARDVSNKVMFLHQGRVEEEGNPRRDLRPSQVGAIQAIHLVHLLMDGIQFKPSVLSTIDVFIKERYMNKLMLATAVMTAPVFR